MGKESSCNAGDTENVGLIPELGRCPGEGNGNPLQFFPGKSHGRRSLVGYSPWGHKESDTTKHAHTCLIIANRSIELHIHIVVIYMDFMYGK